MIWINPSREERAGNWRAPLIERGTVSCSPRSGDMRERTPLAESRAVLNEIAGHVIAGLICFLALTVLWLANDAERFDVFREEPNLAAILWLGVLITFAPMIICVAVGSVRRGEQRSTAPDSEDD
jgi:hypothetical protein